MSNFVISYENYSPAPDIIVLTCCILFFLLIKVAYISKTRSFHYLKHMIIMVMWAAVFDIFFHLVMDSKESYPVILPVILRALYHFGLFSILWIYVPYVKEILQIGHKNYRPYFWLDVSGFSALVIYDIISTAFKFGFYIDENYIVHAGFPVFPFGYIYFVTIIIIMIVLYGNKIYKRVYSGILLSILLSILIMALQLLFEQTTYTVVSFIFPIFAWLYLLHSSPYELEMGAVSERAFEDWIAYNDYKNNEMYIMSLYMHDFDGKGRKYPNRMQTLIREFSVKFFNHSTLFHISGGHLIMAVNRKDDPDYISSSKKMLDEFMPLYDKYRIDYKIVYTKSYDNINNANDYIGFIRFLHDKMPENTMIETCDNDVVDYLNYKFIRAELDDINKRNNIDDERILVLCQPVYNLKQDRFDTAEALMRLKLPGIGIVPPDMFIPIAEKEHYITTLTMIILHKTCKAVKKLMDDGFIVNRVSVNFSMYDLRSKEFFDSIENTIKGYGINPSQIAIEITESQNESDFEIIKTRIEELKDSGIKFYLDDFGTGYSNFERIMELPFDIVKFDRSLVIASGNSLKYRTMVSHLSEMFNNLEYGVLFEGVENYDDEIRCVNMKANYLQGYKYSKPIPIEALSVFFDNKTGKSADRG